MTEDNDVKAEEQTSPESGSEESVSQAEENEAGEQPVEEPKADEPEESASKQEAAQFVPVWHVVANNIFVLLSLSLQYLGISLDGSKETENVDLEQARLAIDLSDMMFKKIQDKLSAEERKGLEDMLAGARFRFVSMNK